VNALAKAGTRREWQHLSEAEGEAALAPACGYTRVYNGIQNPPQSLS
jgi:hypothetical protein